MNEPNNPFRLVVTGSRSFSCSTGNFDKLMERVMWQMAMNRTEIHVDQPNATLHIAEGGADGADKMVREWVDRTDSDRITHRTFMADWKAHGLGAGPRRNSQMLKEWEPEFVLSIWDGRTTRSGTLDCMKKACALGIPMLVMPAKGKS